MAKSSKTTSQRKTANQQAKTKTQAKKQSTDKPVSLSLLSTPAPQSAPDPQYTSHLTEEQTELFNTVKAYFEEHFPDMPQEEVMKRLHYLPFEEVTKEQIPEILAQLDGFDSSKPSFDAVYANYQNDYELVQDFQTVLEEQIALIQKDFANDLKHSHEALSAKYLSKLSALLNETIYVGMLLDYAGDFTGDESKYQLNLEKSRLYEVLTTIYNDDENDEQEAQNLRRFVDCSVTTFFGFLQKHTDLQEVYLPAVRYQSFVQEINDSIGAFVLQRAQKLLGINDTLVEMNADGYTLDRFLLMMLMEPNATTRHRFAKPFEAFVSDKNFSFVPIFEDPTLFFPTLLKIQLKYSPQTFHSTCDDVFIQSCSRYEIEEETFICLMAKTRDKRLKAARKEQAKRVTFTVQNPQEPSSDSNEPAKEQAKVQAKAKEPNMDTSLRSPEAPAKAAASQASAPVTEANASKATAPATETPALATEAAQAPQESETAADATIATQDAADTTQEPTQEATISEQFASKKRNKPISLLNSDERHDLFVALSKQQSQPPRDIKYSNAFELLIGRVLLSHSDIDSVDALTEKLFAQIHSPKELAALDVQILMFHLTQVHMWWTSCAKLIQTAKILHEQYNDQVPSSYEELSKLPSVNPKLARELASYIANEPFISVDIPVLRVCNRTGLCIRRTQAQVEKYLLDLVEPEFVKHAHHYLYELGHNVCTDKNFEGNCKTCVAAPWCKYHKEQQGKQ